MKDDSETPGVIEENPLDSEQAAELAALTAMSLPGDAAPAAGADALAPIPGVDLAGEIVGGMMIVKNVFAPMFPTAAAIYTPETCQQIANAVAEVCKKHGWLDDGIAAGWGPEIVCAAVIWPTAIATVEAAKIDIANRKPARVDRGGIDFDGMNRHGVDHTAFAENLAENDRAARVGKSVQFGSVAPS